VIVLRKIEVGASGTVGCNPVLAMAQDTHTADLYDIERRLLPVD